MSKANFTGKKVALPGSRRYKPLPKWVLDALKEWAEARSKGEAPTSRRVRDPEHDEGILVLQAKKLGFGFHQLYLWSRPARDGGEGIPYLDGEILDGWYDYEVRDRQLFRNRVFSKEQLQRAKKSCTERADASRNAFHARKGWTDYDIMRKFPDVFGKRAMTALHKTPAEFKRLPDSALRPYRPGTLTGYRTKCRYAPEGHIHSWEENGTILNEPEHVNAVVSKLRELQTKIKRWEDPLTKIPHLPTWYVTQQFGIFEQELTRCSKQKTMFLDGNVFHPHPTKRLIVDGFSKPNRLWPESEVNLFLKRREEIRKAQKAKVPAAVEFINDMLSKGPVKPVDGIKGLRDEGYPPSTFRKALRKLKIATDRVGEHDYFWRLPTDPPVIASETKREKAVKFLTNLVGKGAVRAEDGHQVFQEAGFPAYLFYVVREDAGILMKFLGKPGSKEQFHIWYKEGQDPSLTQDLPTLRASLFPINNGQAADPPNPNRKAAGRKRESMKHLEWKRWRDERGLSVGQIARKAGVSESAVKKAFKKLREESPVPRN